VKPLLAPLACGVAFAALLYGVLWAAERRLPKPEDPWLDAWTGDGMKAEFRSTSNEPDKYALSSDARELFSSPDFAGTVLRNYIVQNTSVQVLQFPKNGLAPSINEGRSFDFRFKPQGNTVHVCRVGRTVAFVGIQGKWIPVVGQMKTPKKTVEEIFDAVEETVRRYP
jgi:hypothetical protein